MVNVQAFIKEGFTQNSLVYAAVMYKARSSSSAPLRAYEGDPDNPTLLKPNHPLAKLCQRPNPNQSWREFQQAQTIFLNLTGDAFTYLDRKNAVAGVPSALYVLNPQRVYIVPDATKRGVIGYVYVPEGRAMSDGTAMLPRDIMHVKLSNPLDRLDGLGYGLSPLSSAARPTDLDNIITEFLHIFFERGAVNTGLLTFDMPLDDHTLARIRDRWAEIYGGYEKWGKNNIGVLDQGGKYQAIQMPFKEMGFEVQDERNESRILGPFGVPPILIGSRSGLLHSTYSNYETARTAFWQDVMQPEMMLHEDEYTYYLQSDDGGFVAFDFSDVPALQQNIPVLVTAWATLFTNGYSRNAAAQTVGLDIEEMPDGDVQYMPMNLMPVGASAPEVPALSSGMENADEDTRQKALRTSSSIRNIQKAYLLAELNGSKIFSEAEAIFAQLEKITREGGRELKEFIDTEHGLATELKRANDLLEATIEQK
jgi:HK97 family phage portal protein